MATFIEKFRQNARSTPNKPLFSMLNDAADVIEKYTYKEFDDETEKLAAIMLNDLKLERGSMVLLVYPPGLDFILTFIACFKAGVVAVPVYPPQPSSKKDINMFVSVQSSCKARVALTNSTYDNAKFVSKIRNLFSHLPWPNLTWHVTNKLLAKKSNIDVSSVELQPPEALAFLQYTSGSTAAPKGVMLTQANIFHNLSCIIEALEADSNTVVVSWLPQYHDMGLIGSHLGIAFVGGSGYYMSPVQFIKRPPLWLEATSKYKATHLQAPNFAYKLTIRKLRDLIEKKNYKPKLDLSSVKHIFNAAEPIDLVALDNFNKTLEEYGLDPNAMSPGYGLAEHTVYVCDRGTQRLHISKLQLEKENKAIVLEDGANERSEYLAGCGNPHRLANSGIYVRIVEPDAREVLEDDLVGEVWITSPSKSNGYYGLEEKSKQELQAKLKTEDEGLAKLEWLRTGDLGFMHNGELFICGRIKDLIIIRGRNHFPQDIEKTTEESHKNLRPGCSASFSISRNGNEVLAIVAELDGKEKVEYDEVVTQIKRSVVKEHAVEVYAVVLIKPRTINKTTSGKIRRHAVKASFLSNQLKEEYRWVKPDGEPENVETMEIARSGEAKIEFESANNANEAIQVIPKGEDLLEALRDEVARLMLTDSDEINTKISLNEIGMDSMAKTQLKGIVDNNYGVNLDEELLFDEETSLEKIQKLIEHGPSSQENKQEMKNKKPSTGPSPIKQESSAQKKRKGCVPCCIS